MADDQTLGEVSRNLAALRTDVVARLERIDRRFDDLDQRFVPSVQYNAELAALRAEVAGVRSDLADDVNGRKADKRLMWGAVLAVVGQFVYNILSSYPGSS